MTLLDNQMTVNRYRRIYALQASGARPGRAGDAAQPPFVQPMTRCSRPEDASEDVNSGAKPRARGPAISALPPRSEGGGFGWPRWLALAGAGGIAFWATRRRLPPRARRSHTLPHPAAAKRCP
jgi:hypothetical protein